MSRYFIAVTVLAFWIHQVSLSGQQSNNFEIEYQMPIIIDTTAFTNIWQVGQPSKTIFTKAFSEPNALITDTLAFYPTDNISSFYFKINMFTLWTKYPFFMLLWSQKMDCEVGKDGGTIEVSYDGMQNWVNIFEDAEYMPMRIGDIESNTLYNGTIGISEIDTSWKQIGFCWSNITGEPIEEMYIRFTFYSDSIDTFQEGWMIDNFEAYPTVIDYIDEPKNNVHNSLAKVYPNPSSNDIIINKNCSVDQNFIIQIIDLTGNVLIQKSNTLCEDDKINISSLQDGTYIIVLKNASGKILTMEKIIKTSHN